MPSPFPGMDPFLESPVHYGDLHDGMIHVIKVQLKRVLPQGYYAAAADRVIVETANEGRLIGPDVNVMHRDDAFESARPPGTAVGIAEPVVVPVIQDEFREPYIDILTRGDQGEIVVATIEVLSPSNKRRGAGRRLYLKKQRQILGESKIHLIEIDLLRGGIHTTAVPQKAAYRLSSGYDYHLCVRRADLWTDALVYPVRLPDPLPRFSIPLLRGDGEVVVDLQAAFNDAYDAGPHDQRVDYRGPIPEPPLSPEDAAWVDERLKAAGK